MENGYRIEVLILLRKLERLDKDQINEEERQEAEEVSRFSLKLSMTKNSGYKHRL